MSKSSGKAWATTAFSLGICTSVGANVAHTFVPPVHAANNWHPHIGAVVFSAFWPLALFVSIEVMARVDWPSGWQWSMARFGGLSGVASIAGIASYRHMVALLSFYGEDKFSATIAPVSVDGLLVVATAALLAIGQHAALRTPVSSPEPEPAHDTRPELEPPQEPPQQDQIELDPPPVNELEPVAELATAPSNGHAPEPTSAVRRQQAARATYLASVANEKPLTYQELAKRYKMSERWSRLRIQEAKKEVNGSPV